MLTLGDLFSMYCPYIGFAAAKIEQRALRVTNIPALANVTVYCSITSCIATLSSDDILSNSSIHTNPLSANTIVPASIYFSPVSLLNETTAVKPIPEEPLPVALKDKFVNFIADLKIYDLAVEGSPTINTFMSPLIFVLLRVLISLPPTSYRIRAFFNFSYPSMEIATELVSISNI